MEGEKNPRDNSGMGGLFDALLSNPELMGRVAGMLSSLAGNAGTKGGAVPSDEDQGQTAPRTPDAGSAAGDGEAGNAGDAGGSPGGEEAGDTPLFPGGLASLLANRDLMAKLPDLLSAFKGAVPAGAFGGPGHGGEEAGDTPLFPGGLASLLANRELMAKLPDLLSALRGAVPAGAFGGPGHGGPPGLSPHHGKGPVDRRMALLYALKPYLSEHRRDAIDYFAGINKLGDIFRHMT